MKHDKARLLIVDDYEDIRDVLTLRLRGMGYVTAAAADGDEALEMARAQEFDLMLLDIMMPKMSGYEVLDQMRNDPLLRRIPVIVISAVDDLNSVVRCVELGAEDYLFKPFNPVLLEARIASALEKKRWRDQEYVYLQELRVMQNIDRELNSSLDVGRAMRVTLEHAMQQTAADAGLVGVVEAQDLRIVATEGYTTEWADSAQADLPIIRQAIQTHQPQCWVASQTAGRPGLLADGQNVIAVPMCRGTDVIGLLVVETRNTQGCTDESLPFLERLCDHAAIAVANAQLYAEAQVANTAKSEFVSLVAHELRQPMTTIKASVDLLMIGQAGPINADQANFLNILLSGMERMMKLVSDLADISRIESGQLKLEFDHYSLPETVQEVVESIQGQIEEKGQTLALNIPQDLPCVWCDHDRLIQVLANLVSNAHKYTLRGGQITICAEQMTVQRAPETRAVHVAVQDTGMGIRAEDQNKIFQKFFRTWEAETQGIPGTGLGLSITKNLVEMQGGRIWFESEPGKGTTFHFTLPAAKAQDICFATTAG